MRGTPGREGMDFPDLTWMTPLFPVDRLEDAIVRDAPVHFLAKDEVKAFAGERFHFPEGVEAAVLTDEYNPVVFYDVWLKERVRKAVLETTDWDMLID